MEKFTVGSLIRFEEAVFFVKDLHPKKTKSEPNNGNGNYASIVYIGGNDSYRGCTWSSNPNKSYKLLALEVSPLFRAIYLSDYD